MLNLIKYNISIVKLLLLIKLHNFYKKIEKIFNIKLKNSIYFFYKVTKILVISAFMLGLYNLYYDAKYNNIIIFVYTILITISNFGFIFNGCNNIVHPNNIELFQMSNIKKENISFIFLTTEYIWNKFKELDFILPIIFIMVYVYGSSTIIYTLFVESILFLIAIFRINILTNKGKGILKKNFKRYLFKYIIINFIITIFTYKLTTIIVDVCKICRRYITSLDSLNQDNLQKIQNIIFDKFGLFIIKIKGYLDIDIISILNINNTVILILLFTLLVLMYLILKYINIDYSIQNIKFENNSSVLKKKYINLMRLINKKTFNNFLISKDLDIIENSSNILKKDFFSTVILPYDYFIIISLVSVITINTNNDYLIIVFVIFCIVSLIFNQVNTLVNGIDEIFQFKQDYKNFELYKISKFNIKDLLYSKIYLCLIIAFFPFIIYILSAIFILIYKFGISYKLFISIILLLVISVSIYFFAPKINLYIYAYIMSLSNSDENNNIAEEDSDIGTDKLIHKFCEIPKKLIILPLMYFLLLNSIIRLIDNNTWKYILIVYVVLTIFLIIVENNIINKILKRGKIYNEKIFL